MEPLVGELSINVKPTNLVSNSVCYMCYFYGSKKAIFKRVTLSSLIYAKVTTRSPQQLRFVTKKISLLWGIFGPRLRYKQINVLSPCK